MEKRPTAPSVLIINAHFPNAAEVAEGDAAYRQHLEALYFTDRRPAKH